MRKRRQDPLTSTRTEALNVDITDGLFAVLAFGGLVGLMYYLIWVNETEELKQMNKQINRKKEDDDEVV
jgi:hypothetical protein